jgi:peroxiredoxin
MRRRAHDDITNAVFIVTLFSSLSFSQGIIPGAKPAAKAEPVAKLPYLMIGEMVPKSVTVTDADGSIRPLLSYKSATDILVVGFFDPRCAQNQLDWQDLRILFEAYKEWHVTFVGVGLGSPDSLSELAAEMSRAGLKFPALRDPDSKALQKLHILARPEIVVIDEWSQLRYRGPVSVGRKAYARQAIEAVIGHTEPVPTPEPTETNGCPVGVL